MSIIIKTKEEIEILREGGRRLATVLNKVKEVIQPGISTYELDKYAEQLIREYGVKLQTRRRKNSISGQLMCFSQRGSSAWYSKQG